MQSYTYAVIPLFFILAFSSIAFASTASTANTCSIEVNSSGYSALVPSACSSYNISFLSNASYSKLACAPGTKISSLTFGSGTYNDTVANCSFSGTEIKVMNDSYDNLLAPSGTYRFNFQGNDSNVALGYYFTYVPKNSNGEIVGQGYLSIVPYSLEQLNGGQINSQGDNVSSIVELAKINNYTLPRFGYYAPTSSPSSITLPLESERISESGNFSYSPYWLVDPFWGHDILTFKKFNITSDYNFTPTFIAPYNEEEDIQLPDNTNVFWNFTIIKYSNPKSDYLKFVNGYQVDPNNTVMYVARNLSNGTIRYDRGIQKPGVHEFIGVFKAPAINEQDNSTTDTYSIGISYCTYQMPSITVPGYYTFTYNGIYRLRTFWLTDKLCPVALQIMDSNTVINCRGGSVNSTNVSIMLQNSNNVELEDCRLYGNAIQAQTSHDIYINNSVFTANNRSNIALNLTLSSVFLNNDSFIGYVNQPVLYNSSVTNRSIRIIAAQPVQSKNASSYNSFTDTPNPGYEYAIILSFMAIIILAYIVYAAASKRISNG